MKQLTATDSLFIVPTTFDFGVATGFVYSIVVLCWDNNGAGTDISSLIREEEREGEFSVFPCISGTDAEWC